MGPPPQGPPPGWRPPTGPPPAWTPPRSSGPDLSLLVRGNWPASLAAVLVALGVALGATLIFSLVLDVNGLDDMDQAVGAWDLTVGIVTMALAVFSIDGVASVSGDFGEASGSVGFVPVLVMVLSLGSAVWVFRRLQRGNPSFTGALGDAARAAVVLGVLVFVLSLVFRTELEDQQSLWDELSFLPGIDDVDLGPSRASALFLPMLVLFAVLALACLARADWLSPRLRKAHDLVASPIEALGFLVALLPLLGLAAYAALLTSGEFRDGLDEGSKEAGWSRIIAMMAYGLGNAGTGFLGIGGGGRLGGTAKGTFDSETESDSWWGRVGRLTDETEAWGLWFSIPITLLVLGLLAWFVVRRSSKRGRNPLGSLLVWCGLLFVSLPLLVRLSSVHGSGKASWDWQGDTGDAKGSFLGGMPAADGLLLALIGTGLALLLAVLTGVLDVRGAASRMQGSHPQQGGYPAHPQQGGYPQQQWQPQGPPPQGPPSQGPPPQGWTAAPPGQQPPPQGPPPYGGQPPQQG